MITVILMTIEQIDTGRVMILLGNDDMKDFSLKYSTLSFKDAHSRKILRRLLTLACSKMGIDTIDKKMFVEALPHKSGCLILLTLMPKTSRRKYRIKKSAKCLCAVFENVDSLLDCCAAASKRFHTAENSAYLFEGSYYLIIDSSPVSLYTLALLNEFAECYICSRIAAARIKEAGKPISEGNAVKNIGRFYLNS